MAGYHIISMVVRITPEEYALRYMAQGNGSGQAQNVPIFLSHGLDSKVIIFALAVVAISIVALAITQHREPCNPSKGP